MGWKEATLGELGKVSMCKRILKDQTLPVGDIPFYKIGTFGKTANAFIPAELFEEYRARFSFPKVGDILISASGTIGRCVVYDGKPAYFQDSNIVWIDNDEKLVSNEYLLHFYGACNWNPSKGATISRLYNDDLRKIKINFPSSILEQQRIVAILDQAFADIEKARANAEKNLKNARELFDSYLNQVFSQRGENNTVNVPIRELFKTGAGGTPLKSKKEFYEGGTIPWLVSGEVNNRNITVTKRLITQKGLEGSSAKMFPQNTVVIAMYGATAGEVGILRLPVSTNQAVCGIYPNEKVLPEYLYYFFLNHKSILVAQAVGNAQPNISQQKIKDTHIVLPTITEQDSIVASLDKLSEKVQQLEKGYQEKLDSLDELKKSLLQKAFSGELTKSKGIAA